MKKLDQLIENIFKYCTAKMSKEDKDAYNEYGCLVNGKTDSKEIDECILRKLTIDHLDKCIDLVSQNMSI